MMSLTSLRRDREPADFRPWMRALALPVGAPRRLPVRRCGRLFGGARPTYLLTTPMA
jgi:hypothetical protein